MNDGRFYHKRGAPAPKPRASKLSIPARAHPFARLVFLLMRERGVTYDALEDRSGVLRSTAKAWRHKNVPSLSALAACLGALDHALVAVPHVESMPAELRADVTALAERHGVSVQHLAAWLVEMRALSSALLPDAQARVEAARRRATVTAEGRDRSCARRSRRHAAERASAEATAA